MTQVGNSGKQWSGAEKKKKNEEGEEEEEEIEASQQDPCVQRSAQAPETSRRQTRFFRAVSGSVHIQDEAAEGSKTLQQS